MNMEQHYTTTWKDLMAGRHQMRKRHRHNPYQSAAALDEAIQKERQLLLNSDISLEELVQQDGKPMEESVIQLSRYLAELTVFFLYEENSGCQLESLE